MNSSDTHVREILISRNIVLTEARIEVLKTLHEFPKGFYSAQVFEALKERNVSLGKSTLTAILELFQARGIIKEVKNRGGKQGNSRGRPIEWYKLIAK